MPTYRFTAPDGRTISVTAPEGASAAEAFEVARTQWEAPPTSAQAAETDQRPAYRSPLAPLTTGIQQGLTFGFGDEMGAAIRAGVQAPFSDRSFGDLYREHHGEMRNELANLRADAPIANVAGEIVGGAVQGGAVAKGLPAFLSWLRGGRALVATGATEGALFGAGTADSGERAKSAVVGGLIGAVAPHAVALTGRAVANTAGTIGRKLVDTPQSKAKRLVDTAIAREGLTADEAAERLAEMGPEARLVDLIPETGRAVTAMPGSARQLARDTLIERQAGQQQRLVEAAGLQDAGDFKRGFADFMRRRQSQAAPLYDEAYAAPLDLSSPEMQSVVRRLEAAGAMDAARRKLAIEGGRSGHVAVMDAAKRSLDDDIGAALRTGKNDEARMLLDLKHALVTEVDRQVPVYAQARELFSTEARLKDAASKGRNLFRPSTDLDEVELALEGFSGAEREMFQMGALRGLLDKLDRTPETRNAAEKAIESVRARDLLRLAFPDAESFDRFVRVADAESAFTQTRNVVRGGSPTARIQEDVADVRDTAGVVTAMARGDYTAALGRLLGKLNFGKVSDETLGEAATLLFGEAPKQIERGMIAPPRPVVPPAVQRMLPSRETMRGAAIGGSAAALHPAPHLSPEELRRRRLAEALARQGQ